ncbi:MAG: adenosylmethionine--8-amino-7-oxononanoate transaminase [Limisphaerales bacterium]
MKRRVHKLAQLDQQYVWHPFTQMRDWAKEEPIVLTHAQGSVLRDAHGREYLDANSSIWTNLHGHNHPVINRALEKQLKKIAHSSALGFANEPASLLAEKLLSIAKVRRGAKGNPKLGKVFFSDNGSTALEVALKLSYESTRRTRPGIRPRYLGIEGAYHGDTIGAVSVGHIDLFHKAYSGLLFKSEKVMAPYCYRCPFNKAKPERADARDYRQCNFECVDKVESAFAQAKKRGTPITGFVYEPLMQGAAGFVPQPKGWLSRAAEIARGHEAQLIADEVMTGFGRCNEKADQLFASHQEGVQPDFLCLAKGLTGGYLPMAATLTTQKVFDAFLGEYEDFKSFFHGHSFTGNQMGASASLASLDLLARAKTQQARTTLRQTLNTERASLWTSPHVGDVRQTGNVLAIELVREWKTRTPFQLEEKAGIRVCRALTKRGVITRPVGNVIVLMPPYCTTRTQARTMVTALRESIEEVLGA